MAEARSAVGVQFTVSPDGHLHINYDWDVVLLIARSIERSYKKRVARFANSLKNGLFPIGPQVLAGSTVLLTGLYLAGVDLTFGLVKAFVSGVNTTGFLWIFICLMEALLVPLVAVFLVRLFLRLLFSFQGWMYLERKQARNPPLHIKLWMGTVKALTSFRLIGAQSRSGKPFLFSYQGALPTLPIPSLKDTIQRHLRSVRPLLTDQKYQEMIKLSDDFENGLGPKLQRYLWLKWLWADNYVTDWWEEYVYLRGRSPIVVNSNYYSIDRIYNQSTLVQAARAAKVIHACFSFRRLLLKQETAPVLIQNVIPLCSRQYDRMFNTTRIPGKESDKLRHLPDSTHIAVLHKGRYYRMACYKKGRLLEPWELQIKIEFILNDKSEPQEGERHLAVMTAGKRTDWAQFREKHLLTNPVNKKSLECIEAAALVLVLDEYDYEYDENDPSALNHYGRMMLHGNNGTDRWFDKSLTYCVGTNARIGANVEHSWADAPIMGHMWEYVLSSDAKASGRTVYDSQGNCVRPNNQHLQDKVFAPTRLLWDLNTEAQLNISNTLEFVTDLCNDVDLVIHPFTLFGKGVMKQCGVSPDAFLQMALQLAYRKDAGKFGLTYEASMTRLFREGRTETVRSCTIESTNWVEAMLDEKKTNKERRNLLNLACDRHTIQYKDAMTGKGIDRHLFCLYVVSKHLEIESPFLNKVLSEPWRLSTSQTAVRGEYVDVAKYPNEISAGGGFGPVADSGYGVSYMIIGENRIYFHVSSKKNCKATDSARFVNNIRSALLDMKNLLEAPTK